MKTANIPGIKGYEKIVSYFNHLLKNRTVSDHVNLLMLIVQTFPWSSDDTNYITTPLNNSDTNKNTIPKND